MLYEVWGPAADHEGISQDTLFVLTGKYRSPKRGEWYLDDLEWKPGCSKKPVGKAIVAAFDFGNAPFPILRPYTQKHNRNSKGRFIKGDGAEKPIPASQPESVKRSWWQKLRGK